MGLCGQNLHLVRHRFRCQLFVYRRLVDQRTKVRLYRMGTSCFTIGASPCQTLCH